MRYVFGIVGLVVGIMIGVWFSSVLAGEESMMQVEEEAVEGKMEGGETVVLEEPVMMFYPEITDEDDGKIFVRILSGEREMIAGLFDVKEQRFDETSLLFCGRSAEELEKEDPMTADDLVSIEEAGELRRLASPFARTDFVQSQGGATASGKVAVDQLMRALGAICANVVPDSVGGAASLRENYCTASPDFFPVSCAAHDACYTCIGDPKTRLECDEAFRQAMIAEAVWWNGPFVSIYYFAVRLFGESHYKSCK